MSKIQTVKHSTGQMPWILPQANCKKQKRIEKYLRLKDTSKTWNLYTHTNGQDQNYSI